MSKEHEPKVKEPMELHLKSQLVESKDGVFRMELLDCQKTILAELKLEGTTRDSIALTCAMCLTSPERDTIQWPVVNEAIKNKWSRSGLKYIKDKAWKLKAQRGVG